MLKPTRGIQQTALIVSWFTSAIVASQHASGTMLEEMVVTAARYEQTLSESPASLSVIDQSALLRKTAFGAADLLRDISGLQVTDSGQAGLKRIRIRGEESRRSAILIDSLEVTDHFEVGTPLTLDPAMLQRVEVIRGSGSVLYGSRALGGVVNFITKKGGVDPLQATLSSSYDGATQGWGGFASVYGNVKGLEYRLSHSARDHEERESPDGPIENTRFNNQATSLYLGKTFDNTRLEYSFDDYQSSAEIFVEEAVKTTFPLRDFALSTPQRDRNRHVLSFSHESTGPILDELKLRVFHQRSDRLFLSHTETVWYSRDIASESELISTGALLQFDASGGSAHRVIGGLQYLGDEVEQGRVVDTFSWTPTTNSGLEVIRDDARIDTWAVFLQDEWELSQFLTLTTGMRQYYVKAELEDSNRVSLTPGRLDDDSELIASIALVYEAKDQLHFRALASQGYVYPSLLQLATGAFAGSRFVNPTPALKPETSNTVELGMRWQQGNLSLDTTVFYSESDDYIHHLPCTEQDECPGSRDRVYQNVGASRAHGIELDMQYAGESYTPYGNLTWMKRRNEFEDFNTWDSGVPDLAARVGLRWENSDGERGYWTDAHVRGETRSELMEPGSSRTVVEKRSGWVTLNFAMGVEFGLRQQFHIALELLNLTDDTYISSGENLLGAQRSAAVKLTVDF